MNCSEQTFFPLHNMSIQTLHKELRPRAPSGNKFRKKQKKKTFAVKQKYHKVTSRPPLALKRSEISLSAAAAAFFAGDR